MPQRVLITGVTGFAGGYLAEHLLEVGHRVLGTSPDGAWLETSSQVARDRVELVAWDLGSPGGLSDAQRRRIELFGPEVIYHLAAVAVPADCGTVDPTPLAVAVNVDGTRRVLQLAASLGPEVRVLFVSSSHVYAPVTATRPTVDEHAPLGPAGAYGRTKLLAEDEVRRYVNRGGWAVIARAFQHTGPRQLPPLMLPQWASQFACGRGPVLVQTRDAVIDLSDVRDVVRAYRLLLERGRPGLAYNVGSGVPRRSGEVLELLRRVADPRRAVKELSPGFKQDPIADTARLRQATGWRPCIPLEQTVADTWQWWCRRAGGRAV
ncbi:MAG TPA: NAD-dependent epimerase/dehydratase family protein [Planctomycetaceae bacterium]|nr:NAD-dependent epimerase/dehydratase family protein [Planctomycetaceae bacterium]